MNSANENVLPPSQEGSSQPASQSDPTDPQGQTYRWIKIATIFAVGFVLASIAIQFISLTGRSLALFFVAIVLGEAVSPIINFLARGMKRGVAVGLLFLILIGTIAGLGYILAPQIRDQSTALVESLPAVIDEASKAVDEASDAVDEAPGNGTGEDVWSGIQDNIGNVTEMLVSVPMTVFNSLVQVVIMSFMAAYWIISRRAVRQFLESLVPEPHKLTMRSILVELSATVGGYVRGTGISALSVGTIVFIGLSIMDVNYPLVMAIFAAFGELIPIIGPNLAAIPAIIVAFLDSWQLALAVAIFYLVLQQIESNVIVPLIMSNQADIPPLLVIIAVAFGGTVAGILGAIVAIPTAGALRVLILRVVAPGIRRWTGADGRSLIET